LRKFRFILPVVLLLFLAAVRMHAQDGIGGCEDSPENPTLVLGLIVSAGSAGYMQLRRHLRDRRNRKDN
jgi:XrtJ-associated TM-motif-TM protein